MATSAQQNNNVPDPLNKTQKKAISRLVFLQECYDLPTQEKALGVTPFALDDRRMQLKHFIELTDVTIHLHIDFARRAPLFSIFSLDDRMRLIKGSASEVMILRAARRYHSDTRSIVFANDQPFTKQNFLSAQIGEFTDHLFGFCRKMLEMKVNNVEYSLLTAIVLFTERLDVEDVPLLLQGRIFYLGTLKAYVCKKYNQGSFRFRCFSLVLNWLRKLKKRHLESLQPLAHELTPFLKEIWDIGQ